MYCIHSINFESSVQRSNCANKMRDTTQLNSFYTRLTSQAFQDSNFIIGAEIGSAHTLFFNVRERTHTHTRGSTNHFDTTTVVAIAILTSWVQLQCRLGCVCTCKSWWGLSFSPKADQDVCCVPSEGQQQHGTMAVTCVLAELSFREGNISKAGPLLNKFCGR
jgi:hypothetical protein